MSYRIDPQTYAETDGPTVGGLRLTDTDPIILSTVDCHCHCL
ncbi:hypothetical protein [Thermosynechococcus sp.]